MVESVDDIRSVEQLKHFIHERLCAKENLLADQFGMTEMQLVRGGRACGLQFLLKGPRSVRLGAIWVSDANLIYFYDASGRRYSKVRLRQRLLPAVPAA